jgi:beta-xylosidase
MIPSALCGNERSERSGNGKEIKMYHKLNLLILAISAAALLIPVSSAHKACAWTSDSGNGRFTNPVLYGDYPDPDIIRVGSDFYLATTTFVSIPGLEILHSKDLINWDIASYALKSLDISPRYSLIGGSEYGGGVWAPSLRYHNGMFYVIDNIQSVGTVIFRAGKAAGPWTMNKLNGYLFDPGLMFDDDGTPLVYNGTGGHISVAVLDASLQTVVSNTPAFTMRTGEGSHAYKINGSYYVFNSVYGQYPVLLCSKSTNRTGPFTTITACDNHVPWSSPHQGGIVQLANGDWWGFSLVDSGAVGRDLWEGPVTWQNGYPYFGDPAAPSIPLTNTKPHVGSFPVLHIPSSDDFSGPKLGIQWQWNHNPDDSKWSLSARRGSLRLYTQTAANFSNARNTLTLRTEGPTCTGAIKIDAGHLQPGDRAGLSLLEQYFGYIAVYKDADSERIVRAVNKNGDLKSPSEDITDTVAGVTATTLWLKVHCDFPSNHAQFSYSKDGINYTNVGGDFPMHFTLSTFQGERFGIFNYNPAGSTGWVDVDSFQQGD